MSIHTALEDGQVRDLLTLYDIGPLQRLRPLRGQSAHTNFRVDTEQGSYLLRVHEGRHFRDLIFENEALLFLHEQQLAYAIPEPIANRYGGHFTPVNSSAYASFYVWLAGRGLGNWEVTEDYCRQVGRLLADLHQQGRKFLARRKNPHRPSKIWQQLDALMWSFGEPKPAWLDVVNQARASMQQDLSRRLPHSLVHGELSPANVKVRHQQLRAYVDFENLARAPTLYDLGVAINFWAWTASGDFAPERAGALVQAYHQVLPLSPLQASVLLSWTRFAALRFVVVNFARFEGRGSRDAEAYFRDFRPFAQHLIDLDSHSPQGFTKILGFGKKPG